MLLRKQPYQQRADVPEIRVRQEELRRARRQLRKACSPRHHDSTCNEIGGGKARACTHRWSPSRRLSAANQHRQAGEEHHNTVYLMTGDEREKRGDNRWFRG